MRELLSAKPGQRPTKWFQWSELRKIMIGWAGYKILAFRRHGDVMPKQDMDVSREPAPATGLAA